MKNTTLIAVVCLVSVFMLLVGCGDDEELVIPPLEFSVTLSPSAACIQPGESVSFQTATALGSEPYQYAWSFGDPAIASVDEGSPTVTFPNKGLFTVTVTVTDADGKTATSSESTIRVKDDCNMPVVTRVTPPASLTILVGTILPLTSTVTGGDAPYVFNWEINDVAVSGAAGVVANLDQQNTAYQFLVEGVYLVIVSVTDALGDKDSDEGVLVTVVGSVFGLEIDSPSTNETFAKNANVHCAATVTGAKLLSSLDLDKDPAVVEYLWSFGAGSGIPDSQAEFPNVSYANVGDYTISLTVTSGEDQATDSVDISIIDTISLQPPVFGGDGLISTPIDFAGTSTPAGGIMLVGFNGATILDPVGLTFSPLILADTDMAGGTVAAPAGGPETIIFFNGTGLYISYSQGGSVFGTPILLNSERIRSVAMFGDDPTSDSFAVATETGVKFYTFDVGSQLFVESGDFPVALFSGMTGFPSTAAVQPAGGGFLVTTFSSPAQLWYHDGGAGNMATLIGTMGDRATNIACLDNVCVVTTQLTNDATIVSWDQASVSILSTIPTGAWTRGLDLMLLDNGNYGCVIVAWSGNLDSKITVLEITAAGAVVSSETVDAPGVCVFPDSVAWARNGTTDIVFYCEADGNIVVLSTGL